MFQYKVTSAMMELCLLNHTGNKSIKEGFLEEVLSEQRFKGQVGQKGPNEGEKAGSTPGKRKHI